MHVVVRVYDLQWIRRYANIRSYFTTDSQSVSQYVLVSSTLVGLPTRYNFLPEYCCLKFAVLYLLGALSYERTSLQFATFGFILFLYIYIYIYIYICVCVCVCMCVFSNGGTAGISFFNSFISNQNSLDSIS
jgi:hypothetical protein